MLKFQNMILLFQGRYPEIVKAVEAGTLVLVDEDGNKMPVPAQEVRTGGSDKDSGPTKEENPIIRYGYTAFLFID